MKFVKKLSVMLFVCVFFFQGTFVYAESMLGIEYSGRRIDISGSLDSKGEMISLRVYDENNTLAVIDSGKTNENGEYDFTARLSEDAPCGVYRAVVVSESGESVAEEIYVDNSVPEAYDIYISPDGNDGNAGTKDAPLKTFEAARDKIRTLKKKDNYIHTVHVGGGDYYVSESIVFEAKDSGSEDCPITYKAEGKVTIKGSVKIDGERFSVSDDERIAGDAKGKVYEADIAAEISEFTEYVSYGALSSGTSYYELTSNAQILELAKYPNDGFIYIGTAGEDGKSFSIDAEDMESVWFKGYWGNYWSMQALEGSISGKTANLSEVPTYKLKDNRPYYIFNNIALLDAPGEWYIDGEAKKLYYYPIDGFDDVEISVVKDDIIDINGADNLIFDGISVENTRDDGYFIHGSAENVTIKNAQLKNIGNAAVRINSGFGITIEDLNITSIGGGGVHDNGGERYTLRKSGNVIRGCDISNFGRIYRSYAAGVNIIGIGATVKDNIIHDAPHFGISFDGNNNLITNNEIYNCCQYTRDAGAVYGGRDWLGFGNEISHNYIHDIRTKLTPEAAKINDVHAIYIDDMQSGTSVHNNTIVRSSRAVFVAGGNYNEVYQNIITDCDYGFLADSRGVFGNSQYEQTLSGGKLRSEYESVVKNSKFDISVWREAFEHFDEMCRRAESDLGGIPTGNKIYSNIFSGNIENDDYMKYTEEFNESVYDNYFSPESDVGFSDYEKDNLKIAGEVPEYVKGCLENGNLSERTSCTAEIFENGEVIVRNRTDSDNTVDIYAAVVGGEELIECKKQSRKASKNAYECFKIEDIEMSAGNRLKVFVWQDMKPLSMSREY